MPDISLCKNNNCTLRVNCFRFLAEPNEYRQSYGSFEPNENNECSNFVDFSKHPHHKLRDFEVVPLGKGLVK